MDRTATLVFKEELARLDGVIRMGARLQNPDAMALEGRRHGLNNLQGHANALEGLVVALIEIQPNLLSTLRPLTRLNRKMGKGDFETSNAAIRAAISSTVVAARTGHGADIIAHEIKTGNPVTIDTACDTYLPLSLGGGQDSGGGGGTVVKRALKLLAHI
tara:strand:- start:498 stop:977 length:480 start_codon:yes stop_codon:yes gene_type:complete